MGATWPDPGSFSQERREPGNEVGASQATNATETARLMSDIEPTSVAYSYFTTGSCLTLMVNM